MKYGYSVERVGETNWISRIFELKPIKPICQIKWSSINDTVSIIGTSEGIVQGYDGEAHWGASLKEMNNFLIEQMFIPQGAELEYFDSLDKEDLVNQ